MRTVMHEWEVERYLRLLSRWDYQCVICGHEFQHIACVTIEHIIPKCKGGGAAHGGVADNRAPAHYSCNNLKGDRSLFWAVREVEQRRLKLGAMFFDWLNKRVPGRDVPEDFMLLDVRR